MDATPPDHLTYRVRLTRRSDASGWQITLYDAQSGTYVHFAGLSQLLAYLELVTDGPEPERRLPATPTPDRGDDGERSPDR